MKEIKLTKGMVTIVDDDLYEELSKWKWRVMESDGCYYAERNYYSKEQGKHVHILMHRQITNAPKGTFIDHKNNNSLDNRRENLRLCTNGLNRANTPPNKNSKSGIKGVSLTKSGKYRAMITINTKTTGLGTYKTSEEASIAYQTAAKKHFGEFAKW